MEATTATTAATAPTAAAVTAGPIDAIEKECDKVAKRQKLFHKAAQDSLDKIAASVRDNKWDKVPRLSADIQQGMKEYYGALGKFSKVIDKNFTVNLDAAARADLFEGKSALVDDAVALHFVRQGYFELVDGFSRETNLNMAVALKQQFAEMYSILDSIRSKKLEPALSWAAQRRHELAMRGSHIEFDLHRMQFISLLTAPPKLGSTSATLMQALLYGRKEFSRFGDKHLKEIQRLMCSVLYCTQRPTILKSQRHSSSPISSHPLATSPYADILSPALWSEIEREFAKEFCMLLGMSQDPPLHVSVNVGASAIPTMIKLRTVMDERRKQRPKVEMWSVDNELPVEIPIPRNHRYHSVFACPVSKEQTTDVNPPVMLPCGHVLSRETVLRLSKGAVKPGTVIGPISLPDGVDIAKVDLWQGVNTVAKLKCPYCPNETTIGNTRRVFF